MSRRHATQLPVILLRGGAGAGKDTCADWIRVQFPGTMKMALADPIKELVHVLFEINSDALWGPSERRQALYALPVDDSYWGRLQHRFDRSVPWWLCRVLGTGYGSASYLALHARVVDWLASTRKEIEAAANQVSVRRLLQTLGTECGRAFDPNIWVNFTLREARRASVQHWRLVVIADGRFDNEAARVQSEGGVVWLLERPESSAGLGEALSSHASEAEVYSPAAYRTADATITNDGTLATLRTRVQNEVDHFLLMRENRGESDD
jgi:hypothetical protein